MPTALITGASNGIGLELARVFAREKYDVVLVARNGPRLEEIARELRPATAQVVAVDLSRPEAPRELFAAAPRTDVLVNNAGFGVFGKFSQSPLDDDLNMMQLNMLALVALTRLYLPPMLAARQGRILNVASTAAFQAGPLMAIYYATKAFVLSFSEAIANELRDTGVTVTALCPGPTTTSFQQRADMEDSPLLKGRHVMDARTVAEVGYQGMLAGRTIVIPGLRNQVMAASVRLVPRAVAANLARKLQEKPA